MIKILGSRSVIANGKKNTRKWGIFECPVCFSHIELSLAKGTKNNTCGKSGCRSKGSTKYGSWNKAVNPEDTVKCIPYYAAVGDIYRSIDKTTMCLGWQTLSGFMDSMYTSYLKLRTSGISRITLTTTVTGVLSIDTCKWVENKIDNIDFSSDKSLGIFHSRMLAQELDVKPYIVTRAISKMSPSFGEYSYEFVALGPVKKVKAYKLTLYQYERLRDRILDSRKKVSSNVYLVRCAQYVKIGVSNNISKRVSALTGANPLPIELLYSTEVINALYVEKLLHLKYREFNTHHEWFDLSEPQIKDIKEYLDNL